MNLSSPFINRPVGTTVLAVGLFLVGVVSYTLLPVASLPNVDLPTIFISAAQPGADPATMAATVAAPLERRLSEIAGITQLTSRTRLGFTGISVQFELSRNIDAAARDVQAAINAALRDLPPDLPQVPTFRKANPAMDPILILALTSRTITPTAIYDVADTIIAQRISQVDGVAQTTVVGVEQPAIRVQVSPAAITSMGITLEDIRGAIVNSNVIGPLGMLEGRQQATTIAANDQLRTTDQYDSIVVRNVNGVIIRLSEIASIQAGVRDTLSAAWFNGQPAALLVVTKQANANVIDTVNRIRDVLADIRRWIPYDINVSVLSDRTEVIRTSVREMQVALLLSGLLIMTVVFLFLRRVPATLAAGVVVPLSLAGTCAAMWVAGFSINNISLLALAVSIGFVIDDAIVMIENVFRNMESGFPPRRAALEGVRQIGFTVIAMSASLLAAVIPLLFMGEIVGRVLREFSVTLVFAIVVSTVISLSVTPMICAHLVRNPPRPNETLLDRMVDAVMSRLINFYAWTLRRVLEHRVLTLIAMLVTVALTIVLYVKVPKGYVPQNDSGLVVGTTEGPLAISFHAMSALQQQVAAVAANDPAVDAVGSAVGTALSGTVNQGRLFITLKPRRERGQSTAEVIDRLRDRFSTVPGIQVFLVPAQEIGGSARQSKAQYEFTLWSPDIEELERWAPRIVERLTKVAGLNDVTTDRAQGGLQTKVVIDRVRAAKLGLRIQDIDNVLNNAFAQRQIVTIYTQRNQYRVVLEIDPRFQRDPTSLERIYLSPANAAKVIPPDTGATAPLGATASQVPLSAVARVENAIGPLVVNHQGLFPSITVSYNLKPGFGMEQAWTGIRQAVAEMHLPDAIHTEAAGVARDLNRTVNIQPILLVASLMAVYVVLGVLYENLAHPLTIISTVPSAGLGALLALEITHTELNVVAFIGIILLIGIVKKNGILLVDFALAGERQHGLAPVEAIYRACLERLRPILMTGLAALLGVVPIAIASGPGSDLRRPLAITIIGGLMVSQILTLYTTPVIYLLLNRLHQPVSGTSRTTTAGR
jgi:multidrug efflux pump